VRLVSLVNAITAAVLAFFAGATDGSAVTPPRDGGVAL
jgi:hypothetical protein